MIKKRRSGLWLFLFPRRTFNFLGVRLHELLWEESSLSLYPCRDMCIYTATALDRVRRRSQRTYGHSWDIALGSLICRCFRTLKRLTFLLNVITKVRRTNLDWPADTCRLPAESFLRKGKNYVAKYLPQNFININFLAIIFSFFINNKCFRYSIKSCHLVRLKCKLSSKNNHPLKLCVITMQTSSRFSRFIKLSNQYFL